MRTPQLVVAGLAAAALLAASAPSSRGQDEAPSTSIQRYLADLHLGDSLEDVQRVYPPAQEWPSIQEAGGRVTRVRVERAYAKSFPAEAQTLWLGFQDGRLVEIQLIYGARFSGKKSSEMLADDMALIYGEPRRSNGKFWWTDGRTVLRVFDAELPVSESQKNSVELRTSIQVLERGLFRRAD